MDSQLLHHKSQSADIFDFVSFISTYKFVFCKDFNTGSNQKEGKGRGQSGAVIKVRPTSFNN